MCSDEYSVTIGEISAPFGIRGEVKVRALTDFPEHFEELGEVCVAPEKQASRLMKIESVRYHKNAVLVKFAGIEDIPAADALRGARILIRESELIPLAEDEYYVHDILGMDVVTTEGQRLGKIREILRSPAHDVYVTERAAVPAVREFVISIDLRDRKMVVRPVEGLIQEEADEG
jgi:16S rRNA processing protein RimM